MEAPQGQATDKVRCDLLTTQAWRNRRAWTWRRLLDALPASWGHCDSADPFVTALSTPHSRATQTFILHHQTTHEAQHRNNTHTHTGSLHTNTPFADMLMSTCIRTPGMSLVAALRPAHVITRGCGSPCCPPRPASNCEAPPLSAAATPTPSHTGGPTPDVGLEVIHIFVKFVKNLPVNQEALCEVRGH
ncbi:hypothetical protein E2C01_102803 [Portunus trituberculatus]|uniref:Uncharacterized protein n=1 Tax=Portunus trituberculatus TaxID=210409 RepID=A0A5B7KJ83_PORTR|nr:hypothetical protein [Portunus trituberculatus]